MLFVRDVAVVLMVQVVLVVRRSSADENCGASIVLDP